MDEVMTRHCLKCGKPFAATRDDKVYCCEQHRKQAERARWKKARTGKAQKCLYCGKTFVPGKCHPGMQFCSQAHSKAWKYYGGKTEAQVRAERKPSKAGFAKLDSPVERVCKTCGKTFQTLFPNASYCSDGCRPSFQRKNRQEVEKTCPVCGKQFKTFSEKQRTCSNECSYLLQSRWQLWKETGSVLRKGETVEDALFKAGPRPKKKQFKKKCRECGRMFVPAGPKQAFCSAACRLAASARKRAAKAAADAAVRKELAASEKVKTFVCAECGKEFTRYVRNEKLGGVNHFCSRKCSRAFYHAKERKGVEFAEHMRICSKCGREFKFRVETYKPETFWPKTCPDPACCGERLRRKAQRRVRAEKNAAARAKEKEVLEIKKERDRYARQIAAGKKAARCRAAAKRALEKEKAREEKLRLRKEKKAARILAAREKRRLMREESLRNRAANAAKYAAMRAASMERARIGRQKRAEAQIAAAIEKAKEVEETTVAKALSEGKEIGYGVCKGCGRDFKFVLNPNKTVPEYCCQSCRTHARYMANRDQQIEYGKRYREEKKSGRKEPENLTTYYRGSGFYCRPTGGSLSFSEDRALDSMMESPAGYSEG